MSIPGPKPKPAEVAERQGNPGHRPIVQTPVAVARIAGEPPIALSDRGREIWRDTLDRLTGIPYVKVSDGMTLARYCDHLDRWLSLREKVNAVGEAYETKSKHGDMMRINPNFRAMLAVEEKLLQIEQNFGLTPAARQSILARYAPDRDAGQGIADGVGRDPDDAGAGQPVQASLTMPLGLFAPPGARPN